PFPLPLSSLVPRRISSSVPRQSSPSPFPLSFFPSSGPSLPFPAIGDLLAVARGRPPDLTVIASRGLRRHVHHLRAHRPGVRGRPHDPACEQARTRVLCPC
uniref:Uncharacterized protein n=1 Tax=Triticum urartu TaxID=4572 RepID=A0A8R7PIV4_TRIUA